MNIKAASLIVTFLVCSASAVGFSQDFSADVVYGGGSKAGSTSASSGVASQKTSRIYVSHDKMRLEAHGPAGVILLVNGTQQTSYAIRPATKEYQPLEGGLPEYFRVTDAENACPDWQKAAVEKIDCEKAGHEVLGGRQTVKYKNRSASNDSISAVWIDAGLKFVVKWESANSGVEMRNIQEAQQPADLFEMPQDYEIAKPRKGATKGFSNPKR